MFIYKGSSLYLCGCQMESFQSVVIILLIFAAAAADANSEGDALYTLKKALHDPYMVLRSWDPTLVNPCTWYHVTCNNYNSVIRVDLGEAGLSGTLVSQLGLLSNLQYLELHKNNISGVIPATIGNLTNLVSLDLYNNRLSGSIPSSLGNLVSLKFMRLNSNKLTGKVPVSVMNLASYGNLNIMNISDNYFTGTIRGSQPRMSTIIQDQKAPM